MGGIMTKSKTNRWMIASIVCLILFVGNTAGLIAYFLFQTDLFSSSAVADESGQVTTTDGTWKLNNSYLTDETEFFLPYDGYEYLICDLTITNSTEETITYSSSAIRLVDLSEGVEIEEDVWSVNSQNSFGTGSLAPGETHSGQVGFQIPLASEEAELNIYENEIDTQPIAVFPITITNTPFIAYTPAQPNDDESKEENSAGDDTQKTSFQINDSSEGPDGMTYSLLNIEYSNLSSSGEKASEGNVFIYCYVRVDNTSEIVQDNYADYWILVNESDFRSLANPDSDEEENYTGGVLDPGESFQGVLVFEAPESETFVLYAYQSTDYEDSSLEAYWQLPMP